MVTARAATESKPTVWVFGDQLNLEIASLAGRSPADCRVLLVESRAKLESKPWHIQRAHLVVSAMAHFAAELESGGFDVDHRQAPTLAAGLRAHREQFGVHHVIAMEPMSWDGRAMLARLGVDTVANNQFLCDYEDFAAWAEGRKSLKMEDFYRWVFLPEVERSATDVRPTDDVDVVVDRRAEPAGLARIHSALADAGFDQDSPGPEGRLIAIGGGQR